MRRRTRARNTSYATVTAIAVVLIGATPATAQHADPRPPGWVEIPDAQADAKTELAEAWLAAVSGNSRASGVDVDRGLRQPTGAAVDEAATHYESLATDYASTYGELPDAPAPTSTASSAGVGIAAAGPPSYVPPASKSLSIMSAGQGTYYYCGPASGVNILNFKKLNRSKATNEVLSEKALANASHMRTDANKLTSVWGDNYNRGLNRWRSGKDTGFYVRTMLSGTGSAGRSKFTTAFIYNLNANEPFAVSTGEDYGAGKPRYNGHSNPSSKDGRGHWITAYAYSGWSTSGTTNMSGSFADPMWTQESKVKQKFSHKLHAFYGNFVNGRGIVW